MSASTSALPPRQQRTVDRLLDATQAELHEVGLDALTVRTVAQRAGVSAATAYTYFTSRDHLFAQLFLRHLLGNPVPEATEAEGAGAGGTRDVVRRLTALTRAMATDLAEAPELAAAATRALLGTDPAVQRLRLAIGTEYVRRFRRALGQRADEGLLETLVLTYLGALLQAGMGGATYLQMADQLDRAIAVIMRGH